MAKMGSYTNTLKPQTSDTMHIDEQMIQIGKDNEYCWNVMDNKTRFLLAIQMTKVRCIKDARNIIQKAKESLSQKPDFVATDKGKFYLKAVRKEFPTHTREYVHLNKVGVNHITKKIDNQIIERGIGI